MRGELKRFASLNDLSEAVAKDICDMVVEVVSRNGHFSLALSGGNTPRTLHHLLATVYRDRIPWNSVSVYFGDERFVSHDDKLSNYRMARETLLDLVPVPMKNIHAIPTSLPTPGEAAEAYEDMLRKTLAENGGSLDLLLLGMGKEGHTASLFPNSDALDEKLKWVTAVEVDAVPARRISLTYTILNRSSAVYFLISGQDKSEALKRAMSDESDYHQFPAGGIDPATGRLVWWVDSAALPE